MRAQRCGLVELMQLQVESAGASRMYLLQAFRLVYARFYLKGQRWPVTGQ